MTDTVVRCPNCGAVIPDNLLPDGQEKPWWCSACLHAKCAAAWESTATYRRLKAEGRPS